MFGASCFPHRDLDATAQGLGGVAGAAGDGNRSSAAATFGGAAAVGGAHLVGGTSGIDFAGRTSLEKI